MSDASGDSRWKQTLNLPRTEFPMKGNLAQLEPRMLASVGGAGHLREAAARRTPGRAPFVFHDGPPYANGQLHAGHALNKVLKDIVVKYRNMSGRLCDFVPGWDCHGLPIEQAVEKRLKEQKMDKRALSRDEFLRACREYALEFIDIQAAEFKRMGVLRPLGRALPHADLRLRGAGDPRAGHASPGRGCSTGGRSRCTGASPTRRRWPRRRWSTRTTRAPPSTWPSARRTGAGAAMVLGARRGGRSSFVIWTTTPWTLPANLAIAVHPELEYVFYDARRAGASCVAKDLLPRCSRRSRRTSSR